MKDTTFVKMAQCINDLNSVEYDGLFRELSLLQMELVKLSSLNKRHDKVKNILSLEDPVHLNQVWMFVG